jgi:hypothetical protein
MWYGNGLCTSSNPMARLPRALLSFGRPHPMTPSPQPLGAGQWRAPRSHSSKDRVLKDSLEFIDLFPQPSSAETDLGVMTNQDGAQTPLSRRKSEKLT